MGVLGLHLRGQTSEGDICVRGGSNIGTVWRFGLDVVDVGSEGVEIGITLVGPRVCLMLPGCHMTGIVDKMLLVVMLTELAANLLRKDMHGVRVVHGIIRRRVRVEGEIGPCLVWRRHEGRVARKGLSSLVMVYRGHIEAVGIQYAGVEGAVVLHSF